MSWHKGEQGGGTASPGLQGCQWRNKAERGPQAGRTTFSLDPVATLVKAGLTFDYFKIKMNWSTRRA